MPAADIIRLVEKLGVPYGLERSVKISPGTLADDRYLISFGRAALGKAPTDRLTRIGHELHIPTSFAEALPGALEHADIVHFGYEAAAGQDFYKIYFEYASQVRTAMAAKSRTPVVVHLAYKWAPQESDRCAVTRYTWVPCSTRIELESKLRGLLPADVAPSAHRCALGLIQRIASFADSGELLLMEVDEADNPRRSCDLNVYDAELRMRDVTDLLETTLKDFSIPKTRARSAFDHAGDRMLGHLSAGVGRDGQEFVTIYFGVEAH